MNNADRVVGSILAGAVGDALGAPVEFLNIDTIRERFGPQGTVDYERAHGGQGQITDDTQMTLFTMDGMIRAHLAKRLHGKDNLVPAMQLAYQRWFHTQGVRWEKAGAGERSDGWLIGNRELFSQRAPGSTVMASLKAFAAGGQSPTPAHPINNSKGCGAVMRAAPFALWSDDQSVAFTAAAFAGALTHGHPSGYLSAGALAVIVQRLLGGDSVLAAVAAARAELAAWPDHEETDHALAGAVELAQLGRPTPEQIAERLGGGWVGEEALAIAVCAALAAKDLADGLLLAVNHSGDSDSTGAICGNILGARLGVSAIPAGWLAELELRQVIEQLTLDLLREFGPDAPDTPEWIARYPA
jgi:ADP-ribosylglycohydrolase